MYERGSISIATVFIFLILGGVVAFFVWRLMDQEPQPTPAPVVDDRPTKVERVPPDKVTTPSPINIPTQPPSQLPAPRMLATAAENPTEIVGVVRDEFGNPIGGATVQLIRFDYDYEGTKQLWRNFKKAILGNTAADAEGNYIFKDLTPGNLHTLQASAPEYITQIKDSAPVGVVVNFSLRGGARVEGVVTDKESNEPVSGALVRGWFKTSDSVQDISQAYRWEERVSTDEKGRYSFSGVPTGSVTFMIVHDDYKDFMEHRDVFGGRANRLDFTIDHGLVIAGMVMDKLHDTPVANAQVRVTDGLIPKRTVSTNGEGFFEVKGLGEGSNIFIVAAEGYTVARESRALTRHDSWDPERKNHMVFRLDPTGSAAGIVRDPDGNPVANARVYVGERNPLMTRIRAQAEFRTGADGTFLVKNLGTTSDYKVAAFGEGYVIGVSELITVGPEELRDGVSVRLSRGATISGTVTDEDNVPMAGVRVEVAVPPFADVWFPPNFDIGQQATKIVVTGDHGEYELTGLWSGSYTFNLTHERLVPLEQQRVLIKEPEEFVAKDFSMKIGRFLAGTCVAETGQAAEGATVVITRPWSDAVDARATVAEDGTWRVDGLVKGNYRVQARKPGFSSEAYADVPADSGNLHFRLRENGQVMGSVVAPDGQPVKVFHVSLVPMTDGSPQKVAEAQRLAPASRGFSDEGGRFLVEDVDPGSYAVAIRASGLVDFQRENVFVPSGGPADLGTIRMPRGGVISGTLRSDSGEPVGEAAVVVALTDAEGRVAPGAKTDPANQGGDVDVGRRTQWSVRSDRNGRYEAAGLPAGDYVVRVTGAKGHVAPEQPEKVKLGSEQEVVRDFVLPVACQISLLILDESGSPVSSALAMVKNVETGRQPLGIGPNRRSDAQGRLTLSNLPSGTYTVQINANRFIITEQTVTVASGQVADATIRLQMIR